MIAERSDAGSPGFQARDLFPERDRRGATFASYHFVKSKRRSAADAGWTVRGLEIPLLPSGIAKPLQSSTVKVDPINIPLVHLMKRTGKCPKCGSTEIEKDATVIDRRGPYNAEDEMTIATYQKPRAIIFKGERISTVSAWVCTSCGYLELYADDPKEIKVRQT